MLASKFPSTCCFCLVCLLLIIYMYIPYEIIWSNDYDYLNPTVDKPFWLLMLILLFYFVVVVAFAVSFQLNFILLFKQLHNIFTVNFDFYLSAVVSSILLYYCYRSSFSKSIARIYCQLLVSAAFFAERVTQFVTYPHCNSSTYTVS